MQSMLDIKRRIKSVQNTQKITKVMKMVAAAKLKKAQQRAEGTKPFFEKTRTIFQDVVKATNELSHPLLISRGGEQSGYIVLTSDQGFAGSYNARMINKVVNHIEDKAATSLITIGRKGRDYFKRRDYHLISEYLKMEDYPDFITAQKITAEVIQFYEAEVFDRVYLCYMCFQSALTQIPTIIPLLPIEPEESTPEERSVEYIYEPSAGEVLDWIVPKYMENIIYSALLEAKASEFGARMIAMDSATDNAEEMIEKLTLSYNQARQAAITTEISEVISGAEALK